MSTEVDIVVSGSHPTSVVVSGVYPTAGVDITSAGVRGADGYTGPIGPTGPLGGDSQKFKFDSFTTETDPGSGDLRFNNSSFASVTYIYFNTNNSDGSDVSSLTLLKMLVGSKK